MEQLYYLLTLSGLSCSFLLGPWNEISSVLAENGNGLEDFRVKDCDDLCGEGTNSL
jgi:hypothetical protein